MKSIILFIIIAILMLCTNQHNVKVKKEIIDQDKYNIAVFLPGRLNEDFKNLFSEVVTKVIWYPNENRIVEQIKNNKIDIEFEWQHGPDDHTVLNVVNKYNPKIKVVLCLNWNKKIPSNYSELGYFDFIEVPFKIEALEAIFKKLKKNKKM